MELEFTDCSFVAQYAVCLCARLGFFDLFDDKTQLHPSGFALIWGVSLHKYPCRVLETTSYEIVSCSLEGDSSMSWFCYSSVLLGQAT